MDMKNIPLPEIKLVLEASKRVPKITQNMLPIGNQIRLDLQRFSQWEELSLELYRLSWAIEQLETYIRKPEGIEHLKALRSEVIAKLKGLYAVRRLPE